VPGRAGAAEPDWAGRSRQLPVARPGAGRHPGRTHGPRNAPGWARGPGRTPGLTPCRRASGRPALCQRDRWHQDHRHRDRSYRDRWHQDRSYLGRWHRVVGRPARDHAWQRAGAAYEGHGPGPARGRGAHRRPDRYADRWRDAIAGQVSRVAGPTMAAGRTASWMRRPATRAAADRRLGLAGTRPAGRSPARSRIVAAHTPRIPPARQGEARRPADQCRDRCAAPSAGRRGGRSAGWSPAPSADRCADQCAARPEDHHEGRYAAPSAGRSGDRVPAAGDRSAARSAAPSADRYGDRSAARSADR
jgi:hypothetical protein